MPDYPGTAVQHAAEVMLRQYESQYNAEHLTWRDFADDARAILDAAAPDLAQRYEDLLASIWLYVPWHWVTSQLTTPQKELWADAIDAGHARAAAEDPGLDPLPAERWWRDDGHRD
jgi:hypothetical protein